RLANDRIDGLLVLNHAGKDGAEPLRIGLAIKRAVHLLAKAEGLVFGRGFQQAGAGDIHLVERLHGSQARGAALVGRAGRSAGSPGIAHAPPPSLSFRAIMVSAARAATPPLSPSLLRARTRACASSSVVRIPLPMQIPSCTERSINAREDSLATISK